VTQPLNRSQDFVVREALIPLREMEVEPYRKRGDDPTKRLVITSQGKRRKQSRPTFPCRPRRPASNHFCPATTWGTVARHWCCRRGRHREGLYPAQAPLSRDSTRHREGTVARHFASQPFSYMAPLLFFTRWSLMLVGWVKRRQQI
jgi:hypothetical protein